MTEMGIDMQNDQLYHWLTDFNEDELFYRDYYHAGKNEASLKLFLQSVDQQDAVRRHLVIPQLLPEIISHEMYDSEYFKPGDSKNVLIIRHNRYTPAFLHRHDFFEIIFVYKGQCSQNIGLEKKHFTEGDVIFVAPGIYHTMEVFDDDSVILNILLRKETFHMVFEPLMKGDTLINKFFTNGIFNAERISYLVFHENRKDPEKVKRGVQKLCLEQLNYDSYSDTIMAAHLIFSITHIIREDQDIMESSYLDSSSSRKEDGQILRYMSENIATVTLADVAEHFGFSVAYCSRLIKANTGQGFNEWKLFMRIRRAQQMLTGTDLSVSEISTRLGFENPESFIRVFKKQMNITPAKYRRNMNSF